MKIFVPTRRQKKTEIPLDPHRQNRQNPDLGGSVGFGSEGLGVIPEKNILESTRDPKSAALGVLAKPSIQPTLEPLSVWAAIQGAIPECLWIMGENKQVLAWIEYRSASRGWVSTDPVSATRDQLEQLVQAISALEPDALCVAIRGAVSLRPDVNPSWQGTRQGVSQLARFSRRVINA